ncbi:MAG: hypothetical protein ACYDDC_03690, partial [Thermoplasmataceae archaeon]
MKQFRKEKDKIAIIGMGYVGIPLGLLLARTYKVIGFDIDNKRITNMKKGIPPISEPGIEKLMMDPEIKNNISYTSEPERIKDCVIKIITVGTPYDIQSEYIDYSQINSAMDVLKANINVGDIIILKSTVPPGTTNGVIKYKLESFGFYVP